MFYYFTFGFGQKHEGCYHKIEADDKHQAREQMNQKFGDQWAMQYESAEAAGVEQYGLREIK